MVKSQVVFKLPESNTSDKDKNNSRVYLVPFQYMRIDKEGKPKIAFDYDGRINGNEIDITEQYMELMKQLLEQKEKESAPFSIVPKNKKIDV